MNTQQEQTDTQQEIEKLRLEIVQLREDVEKEQVFHKTIYTQWYELNARMLAKERELKQFKKKNLLYTYTFYLILLSIAPAYYLLSRGKGAERSASDPQTVFALPAMNQPLTTYPGIIHLPDENLEKKEIIQPDKVQPKVASINRPIVVEELSDSVRYLVYWEGWTAYYQKLSNPYQKSPHKYEVWLAGWKEGENDDKKLLTKVSSDTLNPLLGSASTEKP
ncbi:MAG: hypothetical protein ABJA71_09890 [Ginsengibacter sp.]